LGALKRQGVKNFFIFFTMKKIEIKGKLSLNKSTIANLNNDQMNAVKGGQGTNLDACPTRGTCMCPIISRDSCASCPGDDGGSFSANGWCDTSIC
jgi:natural product precursor